MRKIATVAWAIILSAVIAGCGGTVDLNRAVAGKNCYTRDECLRNIIAADPISPRHIFTIQETSVDGGTKSWAGIEGFKGYGYAKYNFYLDLCIAKSIAETIQSSKIIVASEPVLDSIYIYDIRDFVIKAGMYYSAVTKFTGKARYHDRDIIIEADGNSGTMWGTAGGHADTATLEACKDFAIKLRESLALY
ncbi:MAG: hypothetical protein U0411_09570 [Thermodesulfovibrionales bacterium]